VKAIAGLVRAPSGTAARGCDVEWGDDTEGCPPNPQTTNPPRTPIPKRRKGKKKNKKGRLAGRGRR